METAPGKETLAVLRRLIAYSEKIFGLSGEVIAAVPDRRPQPRISTAAVVKSAVVLFWARRGSLNAWELTAGARFGKPGLGEATCSADTLGRVHAWTGAGGLRRGIHHLYTCLKRNKALPDLQGLAVAVLDGHESHARYLRHCPGSVQRTVPTAGVDPMQYYHRQVTLRLLPGAPPGRPPVRLLWDHEPQRAGEEEVTTALRWLDRVRGAYPRAFDLVLAGALYGAAPFCNFLLARGQHALVVLQEERRNRYQDAAGLFHSVAPQQGCSRSRQCGWWDFPGLLSWPQVNTPVRVLRSLETYTVRRQLDPQEAVQTSGWIWATTLPATPVSTARAIGFGHQRWDIENHGCHELVNEWHADHVSRHDPNAIECFLLVAFLAYNILPAFWALNLQPAARHGRTQTFWARLMAAALHAEVIPASRSP